MESLCAPWRYDYVTGKTKRQGGCPFCQLKDQSFEGMIFRGEFCAVVMNAYPYATGHVMVIPYDHCSDLNDLNQQQILELMMLVQRSIVALKKAFSPHGFNVGFNLGSAAGAGVEQHLHCHVVPRWNGDVNFMFMLGNTSVTPMTVQQAQKLICEAWQ